MNESNLGGYRELLVAEQNRLLQSMDRKRSLSGEIHLNQTDDEVGLAILSHDRDLILSLSQADLVWLKAIREAIARIDRGEYGECLNCGEDINERRLSAVPWVELCICCQEAKELSHQESAYSIASLDSEPE